MHPVFPSTVYRLDVPHMRTVTIQCQDNGFLFRQLHKTDKVLGPLLKSSLSGSNQLCDKLLLNLVERYPGVQP